MALTTINQRIALYVILSCMSSSNGAVEASRYIMPDINIIGIAKCGTSHMYGLIKSHPGVVAVPKEWCPVTRESPVEIYVQELTQAIEDLRERDRSGESLSLNACVNPGQTLLYVDFIKRSHLGGPRHRPPKYILLVRDPADLLWASFNFWTNPADTVTNPPGYWTTQENHRTPEYFHELLLAGGSIIGSYVLTNDFFRTYYDLDSVERLIQEEGAENLLVLDSRRMEGGSSEFIHDLAAFTGLDPAGFARDVAHHRTNSGFKMVLRGAENVEHEPQLLNGVYEVSGMRPMLLKSRHFIYEHAKEFCHYMLERYDVEWTDCLRVGSQAK